MKISKKLSLLFIILAVLAPWQAQAITPVSFPYFHVTDPATGMPLVGGLVWSYQSGTSTAAPTYTNTGFSVANTNPIVLDGSGNATIYINQPTKLIVEYPPSSGETHGMVLYTFDKLEAAPYNSYITVGPTKPPTAQTNTLNLYCQGTTLYMINSAGAITSPATSSAIQQQFYVAAAGGGTGDAITATLTPALTSLVDKTRVCVWATSANTTTTPTFAPNGLAAKTIVKNSNQALVVGDIPGANFALDMVYNATIGKWVLLKPASPSAGSVQKIAQVTLSGDATKTISAALTTGVRYELCLNLIQNTAAGTVNLTFNNDTGATSYTYPGGTTGANVPISSTTSDVATGIVVSALIQSMQSSGQNVAIDGAGLYVHTDLTRTIFSGTYAGSANFFRLDVSTSAGTMTGTATLYLLP